ncbi:hypothetical protein ACGFZQ_41695 [Streptomyces sp. NPDC048254]
MRTTITTTTVGQVDGSEFRLVSVAPRRFLDYVEPYVRRVQLL